MRPALLLSRDFLFCFPENRHSSFPSVPSILPFVNSTPRHLLTETTTTPSPEGLVRRDYNNSHLDLKTNTARRAKRRLTPSSTPYFSGKALTLASSMNHLITRCVYKELGSQTAFTALLPTKHQTTFWDRRHLHPWRV